MTVTMRVEDKLYNLLKARGLYSIVVFWFETESRFWPENIAGVLSTLYEITLKFNINSPGWPGVNDYIDRNSCLLRNSGKCTLDRT